MLSSSGSLAIPKQSLKSIIGNKPSSKYEPSARFTTIKSSVSSLPGLNSPVNASIKSCKVTKPFKSPYSSTTNTIWLPLVRMCSSNSIPVKLSGTKLQGCAKSAKSFNWPATDCASNCLAETMPINSSAWPLQTGKRECGDAITRCMFSAMLSSTSKNTISERGTISEEILRSSKRNTFLTIVCSLCSITPELEPSCSNAWISSWVTFDSLFWAKPKTRIKKWVEVANNHTNGRVRVASKYIGLATIQAIASGLIWPIRFGTNSPITMDT